MLREWKYKNEKPRIIAELYVGDLGKASSVEYKITCINEMIEASEKLAQDFSTVRVDFYVDNDDFYFR